MYAKLIALAGSLVLSGFGLLWQLRGDANPLDQPTERFSSALTLYPDGWANGIFLGCALVALATAVALFRAGPATRWVAVAGVAALVVLMDATSLTLAGYLPFMFIAAAFGAVDLGILWSLGLLLQLVMLVTVAAFGWVLAAGLRREHRAVSAEERAERLAVVTARTRRWTKIAIEAPLVYAISRVLMFFTVPGFDMFEFNEPILWAGLGLGVAAMGGAWLTFGLIRPWGEVFPRWMVGLRGRRVPIGAAAMPALLVAVMVLTATKAAFAAFDAPIMWDWPLISWPMLLWPLWAFALAMAAVNYAARRQLDPLSVTKAVAKERNHAGQARVVEAATAR